MQGLISSATVRFRLLLTHFLSPTEEAKLLGYQEGEAQLSIEQPGKPPIFVVLIDGAREEERSLRLRIGRLVSERVDNQHVVIIANHHWMPEALKKIGEEFHPKLNLYQLSADGDIECKTGQSLRWLLQVLKRQKRVSLPVAGSGMPGAVLASESEADFAARCKKAEAEKDRLREKYAELLQERLTPVTFAIMFVQAALFGMVRLWQSDSDSSTVLVQLGAGVPPFVREGEWWRLLASAELHVGVISLLLGMLVYLSLGGLLEKLLGSARFLTLHVLAGLGGALLTMAWPRSSLVVISVGASGTACGLLGAGAVLALDPGGLPSATVQRLRKIAIAGLVTSALLSLVPGVDRPTHIGGVIVGAVLVASGFLRPGMMNAEGQLVEAPLYFWLQRGIATLCGVLLASSVVLGVVKGQPWQPDPAWKKRLGATLHSQPNQGAGLAGGLSGLLGGGKDAGAAGAKDAGAGAPLQLVRQKLGDTGVSIELPAGLGEAQVKAEPGRTPVYEFGGLGEKQQQLSVLLQRPAKPYKKKAQLQAAFDQAVALVKADKLRDERIKVLTPLTKSTLDGQPLAEFHVRMQETVQARGLVLGKKTGVIVLWYLFTDLLPDAVQVDLKRALQSMKDEAADKPAKKGKKKKR
jgi:rhomboid protease GluP